ncbi:hypothetical protein LZ009_05530 [Ramlibacter sp. XY19]|uniref:hypothetical protein n=1 Tax=Ramlibacter paludis TaxID=2908000 RepID=UPI0023DC3AC5|nr:hypothetical protein [Ramlibacter paludis]MCG2592238.1 hypothetical protein [Ramlibacter paludis]
MTKTLSWGAPDLARPFSATLLYVAAAALRSASEALSRIAAARSAAHAAELAFQEEVANVEFHELHRDSGAPEGALYVNGKLVAIIPGVKRL